MEVLPPILDAASGSRMFWYDKNYPHALFGDRREGDITLGDGRVVSIAPDIVYDFRDMPFPARSFALVVFDPPHLTSAGPKSWQAAKYGKLSTTWEDDLRKGFAECWRVLRPEGTLIFKWNDTHLPVSKILPLAPAPPAFGHRSGKNMQTHWITFFKFRGS